jgi:hypothetical protein
MSDSDPADRLQLLTPDTRHLNTAGKSCHLHHPSLRAVGTASRKPGRTKAGLNGPDLYPIPAKTIPMKIAAMPIFLGK